MRTDPRVKRRTKELMAEWATLRFALSEQDAAEAWAESMALHEAADDADARSRVPVPAQEERLRDLTELFPNGLRDATGTCVSCGAETNQQHARRCVCLDPRWYTGPEAEPFA